MRPAGSPTVFIVDDDAGIRASIYNAFPEEGVEALTAFMREFERRNG